MEERKKLVLFDIDYTLFDTDSFRKSLYPSLAAILGYVYDEEFLKLTSAAEDAVKKELGHFSPDRFLELLLEKTKNEILLKDLEDVFWNNDYYAESLDNDAEMVLTTLDEHQVRIGLLSTGDTKGQLYKIHPIKSFIRDDLQHIYPDKLTAIEDVISRYKRYKVYIIDDLAEVLYSAKKADHTITTVLMKRKKQFKNEKIIENFTPDYQVESISEILRIILQ